MAGRNSRVLHESWVEAWASPQMSMSITDRKSSAIRACAHCGGLLGLGLCLMHTDLKATPVSNLWLPRWAHSSPVV